MASKSDFFFEGLRFSVSLLSVSRITKDDVFGGFSF